MSMHGVENEEKIELTKEENRKVRDRSRRLLREIIAPVKGRLVMALVLVVTAQGLRVVLPGLVKTVVDTALPAAVKGNYLPLIQITTVYLLTAVAASALIAVFVRYAARTTQNIMVRLRTRLFEHTQKLSIEFHETYTSGRVISRQTNDLDSIQELLNSGGSDIIAGFFFMLFTAVALILLDWQSFMVVLVSFIPLGILTYWFQNATKINYRKTRVASARLIVHFVETMTGIRAVKAFRKEKRNEAKYAELVEDYRNVNAKVIQLFGIFDPGLIMIGRLTAAMVCYLAACAC